MDISAASFLGDTRVREARGESAKRTRCERSASGETGEASEGREKTRSPVCCRAVYVEKRGGRGGGARGCGFPECCCCCCCCCSLPYRDRQREAPEGGGEGRWGGVVDERRRKRCGGRKEGREERRRTRRTSLRRKHRRRARPREPRKEPSRVREAQVPAHTRKIR